MSPSKTLRWLYVLCLPVLFNAISPAFAQGSSLPQLITSRAPRGAASLAAEPPSLVHPRSSRITINTALLDTLKQQIEEARDGKFPRIEVRPFDDVVLTVEVRETELETRDQNMRYFRGYVLGILPGKPGLSPTGTFGINIKGGVAQGAINFREGQSYEFQYIKEDGLIVRFFDSGHAPESPPVVPGAVEKNTPPQKILLQKTPAIPAAAAGTPASPDIIDVLVVYTVAAIAAANGEPSIRSNINAAIGSANHAYVESNVNQRVRLAFAGATTFAETASLDTDLTAMQGTVPELKDMRRWRDQFAADMVSL